MSSMRGRWRAAGDGAEEAGGGALGRGLWGQRGRKGSEGEEVTERESGQSRRTALCI